MVAYLPLAKARNIYNGLPVNVNRVLIPLIATDLIEAALSGIDVGND